jgi:hypothetical protein
LKQLLILLLLILSYSSWSQERLYNFLIFDINVEVSHKRKNNQNIKEECDLITLSHCSNLVFLPDSTEFYIIDSTLFHEILGLSKEDFIIVIHYLGENNFSNGGDDIDLKILKKDSSIYLYRSFEKNVPLLKLINNSKVVITDYLNNKVKSKANFHKTSYKVAFCENEKIKINETFSMKLKWGIMLKGYKYMECD